jgi:predicted HicB family RNase H-like nuclease
VVRTEEIVAAMRANPVGVRYSDLMKVCVHYFGKPRQRGGSHAVFRTPWPDDPAGEHSIRQGKSEGLPGPAGTARDRETRGGPMTTQTAVDTAHYTYRVTWSAEDGEFVATCLEFPSLAWLAGTQARALSGIRRLIDEVVADLVDTGETVPLPLAERQYSGRFNIRISPDLHRELALKAADRRMSLNRYLSDKLARE